MKLDIQKGNTQSLVSGQQKTTDVRISQDKLHKLMHILSAGLYSNPIGTIVREYTSNCFDSHTAAKVDDPVVIKLTNKDITFVDFGVGFNQQSFEDIFCNILESTKDGSNEELGMWGLGSKSAFSYTNQFTVMSVKDGHERMWSVRKENNGSIQADLIYSEPTQRDLAGNTTEVCVPIKSGDFFRFKNEIKAQLKFFSNVYLSCSEDTYFQEEFNNAKIYEGGVYRCSTIHSSRTMSLCLGVVEYPIDWNFIELSPIQLPISIKFNIGEVGVTPSRESILWDDTIKGVVIDRIKEAMQEMVDMYNAENTATTDNIIEYKASLKKPKELTLENGVTIDMSTITDFSEDFEVSRLKYTGIFHKSIRIEFKDELKKVSGANGSRISMEKWESSANDIIKKLVDGSAFTYTKRNSRLFKYISAQVGWGCKFVRIKPIPASSKIKGNDGEWEDIDAKTLASYNAEIERLSEMYDVETKFPDVTEEDLKMYSHRNTSTYDRKERVGEDEFVGGYGRQWNAWDVSFKKENIDIDELDDIEETVFYGTWDDRYRLKSLWRLGFKVLATAQSNFQHIKDLQNFFHISEMYNSMDIQSLSQKSVNSKAMAADEVLIALFTNKADVDLITKGEFLNNVPEEISDANKLTEDFRYMDSTSRSLLKGIEDHFNHKPSKRLKKIKSEFGHLSNIKYLSSANYYSAETDGSHIPNVGNRSELKEGEIGFMKHYHALVCKVRECKKNNKN